MVIFHSFLYVYQRVDDVFDVFILFQSSTLRGGDHQQYLHRGGRSIESIILRFKAYMDPCPSATWTLCP